MKKLALILLILSGPLGCSSIFIPSVENSGDVFPRETDLPGWTIAQKHFDKNEERKKVPHGLREKKLRLYENYRGQKVLCGLFKFSNEMNAYGFFSQLRGYGKYSRETAETSYMNKKIAVELFEKDVFMVEVVKGGKSPVALEVFLKNAKIMVKQKLSHAILNLTEILHFKKNFVIYEGGKSPKFDNLDRVFHTRVQKYILFFSRRNSSEEAFRKYSSIIKSKGYSVINSDKRHASMNMKEPGNMKFLEIRGKFILGVQGFVKKEEISPLLDKLETKLRGYLKK